MLFRSRNSSTNRCCLNLDYILFPVTNGHLDFERTANCLRKMAKESLVLCIYYDQVVQNFQIDGAGVASLQVVTLKP